MSVYELLLIVPALLILMAIGMVVISFFQYTPSEIFSTVGQWFKANAVGLSLYGGVVLILVLFVV